ncbi:SDR family NAD(P)-dependent oxidoreductase [Rhodococcus artemisiae]|uniref:3-oxoacyl-[acyl-carrier-protein] reductase MabA n=1 Tax=Rhodococcus artemisiae TaxID=714159 RepID=A0ABU7LB66_9NOCA|nr:SDR family oxidoreductase [Rhodococcus artemisiae]MEE2058152.1 SDR family oxidoreductase [Rhodococcus artemisiae]
MLTDRPHPKQAGAAWDSTDIRILSDNSLSGRHAVITGAGSGIGQAIAIRLAELGAHVVGIGRNDNSLRDTEQYTEGTSGSFRWFQADVRDSTLIRSVIAKAAADTGIDILVNNAGGQFYAATDDITDNGFRSVVDLNLNSVFTVISEAKPFLALRGGSIVNISLSGVDRGSVGLAHSLAARAGVLAMTKTIALEWAHLGIRANCVAPGVVISELLPAAIATSLLEDVVPRSVPAGRPTPVADVAELVAYLATPASRMITGQVLQIDGAAHLGRGLHMVNDWPPSHATNS